MGGANNRQTDPHEFRCQHMQAGNLAGHTHEYPQTSALGHLLNWRPALRLMLTGRDTAKKFAVIVTEPSTQHEHVHCPRLHEYAGNVDGLWHESLKMTLTGVDGYNHCKADAGRSSGCEHASTFEKFTLLQSSSAISE